MDPPLGGAEHKCSAYAWKAERDSGQSLTSSHQKFTGGKRWAAGCRGAEERGTSDQPT